MLRSHRTVAISAIALASACSAAIACSDQPSSLCLCGAGASAVDAASFTFNPTRAQTNGGELSSLPTSLVHVFNFDFSTNPSGMPILDATINVGDTIRWQWDSGFHSVTSVAGSIETFNSGNLVGPGPTFDWNFAHAGVFNYYCDIHGFDNGNGTAGGMSGTITVLQQLVSASWNVDSDGSWQTAGNWTNNTIPNGAGHTATFGPNITGPRGVQIDAPTTVGSLNFNSGQSYTIGGTSTLSLSGSGGAGAIVTVGNGNHTISAPLKPTSNTTFGIAAASSLTATNLQPSAAALTKAGVGTFIVNNLRTSSSVSVSSGTVAVASNGSNSGTSQVGTLSISAGATLDLRDNDLIVQHSSYGDITARISAARNGGAWNQPGLTSSTAGAALPANKTLGVLSGAQYHSAAGADANFDGFNVTDTDVLVKFTYYGDTDFNGVINFDDYSRTDAGFNTGGSDWFHGDFDYNGSVNFDDYSLIDAAFNTQSGSLRRAIAYVDGDDRSGRGMNSEALRQVMEHYAQFGEPYAQAFLNAVPEPTSALLFGVPTSAGMMLRRRRQ